MLSVVTGPPDCTQLLHQRQLDEKKAWVCDNIPWIHVVVITYLSHELDAGKANTRNWLS